MEQRTERALEMFIHVEQKKGSIILRNENTKLLSPNLKGETVRNTTIVGDFNTTLTPITSR